MNNRWVKSYVSTVDSKVFACPYTFKVWHWLLYQAQYKDRIVTFRKGDKLTEVELKRGQLIYGRKSAAEALSMAESRCYRIVKKLKQWGKITLKANSYFTLVTICKYDSYQGFETASEQQLNSKRTATEQQLNTYNKDNNIYNNNKASYAREANLESHKDRINEPVPENFEEVERFFFDMIQNDRIAKETAGRFWQEMVDKDWKISNGSQVHNWKRLAHVSYIPKAREQSEKLKQGKFEQRKEQHGKKMLPNQNFGPPKKPLSYFYKDYRNN